MASSRLIKVYGKQGEEYTVSYLNAHDMVRHLGYTYKPGREFSPVDPAPFDVKPASKASEKRKVQAVLDGVGTDFNGRVEAEEEEDEDAAPAVFDAVAMSENEEVTELPTTTVDDEPSEDAPKRRGRPPKA